MRKITYLLICIFLIVSIACAQDEPEPAFEFEPVERIEFSGNTVVSDAALLDAIRIRPGEPFSAEMLSEAVRQIEDAYTRRGFISDFIFFDIQTEPPRTLVFIIREVTIFEIQLEGLVRTSDAVIRRVIDIEPGEVYSQVAIQQAIVRLNALGIFEEIRVFLEEAPEPGQVIVIFEFDEARTRRVDVSGTYSPEGSLIGHVQYTEANLFGLAQRLTLGVNIGTVGGRIGGQATYLNPAFRTPRMTLMVRAYSDVLYRFGQRLTPDAPRYFERRYGIQTFLNAPAGENRRMLYGIRYETANVQNVPPELISPISLGGSVAMSSARITEDRRLMMITPASGEISFAQVEVGYSDPRVGSSGVISKLQAERRWYIPLQTIEPEMVTGPTAPIRVLALRAGAGTSLGDLPFFEQYFVGGVFDLRGYRESRFWGKNFLRLNAELRWRLGRRVIGTAFVDAGDAWGSDFILPDIATPYTQHQEFSPRIGAGVGLWWLSEMGVFRLEYARGEADRIHFAIGETF